ncbi:MAG: hypothetical protein ABF690_15220, partial [Liquorilactobacillus nagelii]
VRFLKSTATFRMDVPLTPGFRRFSVRGLEKVKREAGIALMAMNIRKLVAKNTNYNYFITQKKRLVKIKERFSLISFVLKDLWHGPSS